MKVWIGATLDDLQRLELGMSVPVTVLLDKKGEVAKRERGSLSPGSIDDAVEKLLGGADEQPKKPFDSIEVVQIASNPLSPQSRAGPQCAALLFRVHELPFLSKVGYSGSRLLSPQQIEKMLEERKLVPGLGKPADPAALQRIAVMIRSSLNELGHPESFVQVHR